MVHTSFLKHFRPIVIAALLSLMALSGAFAQSSPLKIATIGSGNIGSTVGGFWIKAGHPVLFSSRHPEELKPLVEKMGPLARAGTVKDALAFGDVILMAVPYGVYPQIAKDYAKDFTGKIMVDAGNAVIARDGEIAKPARENGVGLTTAKLFPGARVVRAFNILGTSRLKEMANHSPRFAIPVAGDDQEAVKVVSGLVREAGFDPVVVGSLQYSKLFEQTNPLYGAQMSADEMREKLKTLK
jgi:8-hydroxy-5-deazaflavin:NADPH oxidoreductase